MSETNNSFIEAITKTDIAGVDKKDITKTEWGKIEENKTKLFSKLSNSQKMKVEEIYSNIKNTFENKNIDIHETSVETLKTLKQIFQIEKKEKTEKISSELNIDKNVFDSFLEKFTNADAIVLNLNNVLKLVNNSKIENYTKKEILDKIKSLILNNNLEKGDYSNFYNFSKTISSIVNPIIKENERESVTKYVEDEKEKVKQENMERAKDIKEVEGYFPGIKINKESFDNLKGGEINNLRPEKMLLDLKNKIESFNNLNEEDIKKIKNIVSTKFNVINNYVDDINKDYSSEEISTTEFSSERFKIQTKFENQFTFVNTELLPNLAFLNKYEKQTGKGVIADKIKKIREKWNNMTIDNDGDLSGGAFDFFNPNLEEVGELKNKKGESFIKKEDAIKEVDILSESDKKIKEKAERTFYALIAGQIAVETAGGLAGTVAGGGVDIYDVFSKDEALIVLGQKMGLIQKDFAMEKTFIDNVLAGIGLLPGATQAIKGTKLVRYLKTLTGNQLNSFFTQIDKVGQKMGLDKGKLNTWVRDFISIDGKVAVNKVKKNAKLNNADRLKKADELLGGKGFSVKQNEAIKKAHEVGIDREGSGVYNYTNKELAEKSKILKEAGFTHDEVVKLMDNGIVGLLNKKTNLSNIIKALSDNDLLKLFNKGSNIETHIISHATPRQKDALLEAYNIVFNPNGKTDNMFDYSTKNVDKQYEILNKVGFDNFEMSVLRKTEPFNGKTTKEIEALSKPKAIKKAVRNEKTPIENEEVPIIEKSRGLLRKKIKKDTPINEQDNVPEFSLRKSLKKEEPLTKTEINTQVPNKTEIVEDTTNIIEKIEKINDPKLSFISKKLKSIGEKFKNGFSKKEVPQIEEDSSTIIKSISDISDPVIKNDVIKNINSVKEYLETLKQHKYIEYVGTKSGKMNNGIIVDFDILADGKIKTRISIDGSNHKEGTYKLGFDKTFKDIEEFKKYVTKKPKNNSSIIEKTFLKVQKMGKDIDFISNLENLLVPDILKKGTKLKLPNGKEFTIKNVVRDKNNAWEIIDMNGKNYYVGFNIENWIKHKVIPDSEELNNYKKILNLKESGEGEKILNRKRIIEAQRARDRIIESNGKTTLSKEDFYKNFSKEYSSSNGLKQGNTGDCYLVAAIDAISRSPNFELMMRTSVKKLSNGGWEVKIPFMDPNGKIISISQKEIKSQWNPNLKSPKKIIQNYGEDLLRPKLTTMEGNEGYRVLEAAYIKNKFNKVDRLAAEGGHAIDVLGDFGGKYIKKTSIYSHNYDNGAGKITYPGLKSLGTDDMNNLDNFLNNYDSNIHIGTASTHHNLDLNSLPNRITSKLGFYKADGSFNFFVPGHAYSIKGVDSVSKTIILANPWKTSKSITLSFDDFKNTFSGVGFARIDNNKLLEGMENLSL